MKTLKVAALLGVFAFAGASAASAQHYVAVETARGTVLHEIPNATIVSYKLMHPNRHNVYYFTVRDPGVTTTHTVYVDANSGHWVTEHDFGLTSAEVEHKCNDEGTKCSTEKSTKVDGMTVSKSKKTVKCDPDDNECKVKVKKEGQ
jgi:hypothetical protein